MARTLGMPDTAAIHQIALKVINLKAARLVRISRHLTGEPYFGRAANHRFDDPKKQYGTCYLGLTLGTAVAESILHDLEPVAGRYRLAPEDVQRTFVHGFSGNPVRVADLTGAHLNRLSAHAELSGTPSYDIPMQWSRAIYDHPNQVDGFMYMSRLYTSQKAVVLFDRGTSSSIVKETSLPLYKHSKYATVAKDLGIVVE